MKTTRHECDDNATAVSKPEGILRDCREIAPASHTVQAVGILSIALHSLKAALKKVATPLSSVEGEDKLHEIADPFVSEERPAARTMTMPSTSSEKMKNALREQITSISALVEDDVVCLFWRCGPSHGIQPGHEGDFRVTSGGQQGVR